MSKESTLRKSMYYSTASGVSAYQPHVHIYAYVANPKITLAEGT